MPSNYRYILEPYQGIKTRYECPSCQSKNSFTRFIDKETSTYLSPDVGICNHKNKCGYSFTPKDFFRSEKSLRPKKKFKPKLQLPKPKEQSKISSFNFELVKRFSKDSHRNNFYRHYKAIFNDYLDKAFDEYFIGTYQTKYIIFWQVDFNFKVRTGKMIDYDLKTGKRKGIPLWYHKCSKQQSYNLRQVPFGSHLLLKYPQKKIAIVESEKTALLMSIAKPEFIWLAVGSCQNLSFKMLTQIQNRDIILYPDAGKYELWKSKIKKLPTENFYHTSDLLNKKATKLEKEEDSDIADYYINIVKQELDFI